MYIMMSPSNGNRKTTTDNKNLPSAVGCFVIIMWSYSTKWGHTSHDTNQETTIDQFKIPRLIPDDHTECKSNL